jgi:hypothetical protein
MRALISNIAGGLRWRRLHDMKNTNDNPWIGIGLDAWRLGVTAADVIGLRLWMIAQGGERGRAEADLMVEEKVAAGFDLHAKAISGGLGGTPASFSAGILAHYQPTVSANRRRLSRA